MNLFHQSAVRYQGEINRLINFNKRSKKISKLRYKKKEVYFGEST